MRACPNCNEDSLEIHITKTIETAHAIDHVVGETAYYAGEELNVGRVVESQAEVFCDSCSWRDPKARVFT